jgi:serine/threonine protein kinase/Flp pilus assembly protein TadD
LSETIQPNTIFSHYKILSKIGAGGMGQVYLAEDTSELGRTVAIKLLPSQLASDPKWMRRFIREARSVSALNHPNVLTIYEFGQHGPTRFIAMEYVAGVTLREHMAANRLNIHEVLAIAMQIAAALNAAHEAHVVHRDIKPENIMIRRDGIVKILDFGLAKPVVQSGDSDPGSSAPHTEPGIVLGTVSYMSPEQSAGAKTLDYRTDIWSLGVVLYEMVAGRVPFQGQELYQQVVAIQEQEPAPLSSFEGHVPRRLEQIVAKALAKNPDDRYPTANDFLTDLKNLKRQLENEAEHDRTALFDLRSATAKSEQSQERPAIAVTTEPYAASSAEYIVNQFKLHKRAVTAVVAVIALSVVVALVWYIKHKAVALLTDKDTILLTEFENKTGDEVFDLTLRQGLAVQLQQSPFLDIFPDQRIRATLQLMSLSPDEKVTRDRAREICQRQGLKAFIAGTIVKFDRNYSITLEALNAQTGAQVALVQVEAEGKDQVLKALSKAASELREQLGESLSSIQKFDAKLDVTTSSLEALKEYASGRNEQDKGQFFKAIEFYTKATEKDPQFATAWLGLGLQYANTGQPGLATECLTKAFALSGKASEDERARITYFYYQIVTGELDKAIEAQEAYVRNYPRESRGPGNLGNLYSITGQFEKSVAATHEAQKLNPNTAIWPGNLAEALIGLNRFDEARDVCRQALAQKLDSMSIRERMYAVAFVTGDAQSLQEQLAWASGRPDEHRAVSWTVQSAAFAGEWKKSNDNFKQASELAQRAESKEVVAGYTADQAVRAAWLGRYSEALSLADTALSLERNRNVLTRVAFAFALSGEAARAQSVMEELEQKFSESTLVDQLWLPQIRAALELKKGNAAEALEQLEKTRQYEAVGELRSQTLRTLAYLKLGKGTEAVAEAQRILDHRGEGALSLLWPFAKLNLARAAQLQSDTAKARKGYEEFLVLWKNADADLQWLQDAKKEYEKLK